MQSVDGVRDADFSGTLLAGNGTVVLRRGTFRGCDAQYFYEGEYQIDNDDSIAATVRVEHYAGPARSIFTDPDRGDPALVQYTANLEGGPNLQGQLVLTGNINGNPAMQMFIVLTRVIPGPFQP
jgi:hypothetical protein